MPVPVLDAMAKSFLPLYNPKATSDTTFLLNPCVKTYVKCNTYKENAVIGILVFIIVILSMFTIAYLISDDICPKHLLKKFKLDNPNKIMLGHLNINSIRQKFAFLKEIIEDKIDILLVSETKINDTFPVGQFSMNRFHIPFREDRNDKGGGGGVIFSYVTTYHVEE